MNAIVEIILEFILLGTIDTISSKKVPIIARVLLAIILLTFYIGLVLLLCIAGIDSKNLMLIFAAGIVLFAGATLVFLKLKQLKRKKI